MDFSSLDLLASTALRDNNPTHADTSTTLSEPHHPRQNHHDSVENQNDEDDDDDEADGNKDCGKDIDTGASDEDLLQGEMGSVKCGKHKKNSAKPMSIFVRDGKCVARHLSTDKVCDKETGGEKGTEGSKANGAADQEGGSSPQNITVHCTMSPQSTEEPSCNGISSSSHQNAGDDSFAQPALEAKKTAVGSPVQSAGTSEVSCDSKTGCCTNNPQEPDPESDSSCVQAVEGGLDAAETSEAGSSRNSSTFSAISLLAREGGDSVTCEQPEGQSQGSDSCHKETHDSCTDDSESSVLKTHTNTHILTDRSSADVLTCSHVKKGKDPDGSSSTNAVNVTLHSGVDGETSLHLVSKVLETAVESRTSNVCDEDSTITSSCSQKEEVKAGEQNDPSTLSVDQGTGSLGSKASQSTSSIQCEAKSLLSPPPPPPPLVVTASLALLDHTYCKIRLLDNADDSGDAFESADENVSADETERRPRSLSVDSVYLQYNLASLSSQSEVLSQNDKLALLSPTLSVDSISNDSSLSEHSTAAGGQSYSILVGSPTPKGSSVQPSLAFMDSPGLSGDKSATGSDGACRLAASTLDAGTNSSLLDANSLIAVGPKCGKFRIGTFGSFSNTHLDLEKESKKKLKNGLSSDPVMKTSLSSPAMAFPNSPFPLLQSPGMEWDRSDAGSEAPDDLDSSTTEDKFLSSSHDSEAFGATASQVWRHPVFHDHDYCSKEVSEEYLGKPAIQSTHLKTGKRKYVKKKDRLQCDEEKLRKGKYLKRELLKQDNRFNLAAGRGMDSRAVAPRSSLLAESLTTKPNPVGRPRKRAEKQLEEYDVETGTKMKITGKYQDQYVYYLNKSSRNRRRKVDEKMPPGDKIILPAPKPGDIVVPHLSDADCEAIRHGGRMAFMNNSSHPAASIQLPHTDSGDMDSRIVNTILSMETEHGNLHSSLEAYDGVGSGEDFADIEGNLTSEQVKFLFDCLEECPEEETTTSQELDLFTSAEAVSVTSTTVDSLAATSVEDDLMAPGVVQSSTDAGITDPSGSMSLLSKADPSSPAQVKLEQDGLEMKTDIEHAETKPLVHGLPVPPTSQPSVEKNLEFLKTPFFPVSSDTSSAPHQGLFAPAPPTTLMGPLPDSKSDELNETPWIVTVTLYWNDIPAIVINNVPHVRLVDIHRQILPAKDTGILKKRCQLMSIQVSNCSEMQRYFLVQYGRAHNSKSTLVISKDEAQRLITYYAHPPPRNLRGEEGLGLRRSASYAELRSIMERPSTPGRHPAVAFSQPRKRGGFRRRPLPTRSHNTSPEPAACMTPPVEAFFLPSSQSAAPTSPAKGLRHKKINFREMLKGEDCSSQLSPLTDGGLDEDSTLVDYAPTDRGRGSKSAANAGGKKRRGSKETPGAPPAKRGRKPWRKNGKEGSQEVPKKGMESESVQHKDISNAAVGTKNKKRSPGSTASSTLNASGRSPKSKYGPIKVNVKSLVSSGGSHSSDGTQPRKKNLFGRKSSSSTDMVVDGSEEPAPRSNPLRVLRISHQDVEATSPPVSQFLSPTAEVHLDLYKCASSACVKCGVCHKFLSVASFLQHQHVSGEEEVLVGHADPGSGHRRRILVPRNKENISLDEQRLWNEFVALQESLDHAVGVASMGAYPLTPLSPASPIGSSLNALGDMHSPAVEESPLITMTPESPHPVNLHNGHNNAGLDAEVAPQSVPVMEGKCVIPADSQRQAVHDPSVGDLSFSADAAPYPWDSQLPTSSSPSSPLSTTHTENEEKCLDNILDISDREMTNNNRKIQPNPKTVVPCSNKRQWSLPRPRRIFPATSIRTSSRKRETKRLYSFEKYEFGVGGKKGARGEMDTQDYEELLPSSMLEDVSSATVGNTMHHLTPVATLHDTHNA